MELHSYTILPILIHFTTSIVITIFESGSNLSGWLLDLQRFCKTCPQIILIANKSDLKPQQVDPKMAREFAEKHQIAFVETSAKDGQNVETAFHTLTRSILLSKQASEPKIDENIRKLNEKKPKKDTCCIMM